MTTIVYDHKNKTVSYDSMVSEGTRILDLNYEKAIRKDEHIYICAGSTNQHDAFIECLISGDCPPVSFDCDILRININTHEVSYCFAEEGDSVIVGVEYNYAIGCGGQHALNALDFGKSSKEAVEYAITKDNCTGGVVRTYDLNLNMMLEEE